VAKSGSPTARLTTSLPWARISWALAFTASVAEGLILVILAASSIHPSLRISKTYPAGPPRFSGGFYLWTKVGLDIKQSFSRGKTLNFAETSGKTGGLI
jgi:hypothetical protein